MPLSSVSQKFVDDFFAAIAPFEKAFGYVGFSYLAVRLGEDFMLLRGRLFLSPSGSAMPAAFPISQCACRPLQASRTRARRSGPDRATLRRTLEYIRRRAAF